MAFGSVFTESNESAGISVFAADKKGSSAFSFIIMALLTEIPEPEIPGIKCSHCFANSLINYHRHVSASVRRIADILIFDLDFNG